MQQAKALCQQHSLIPPGRTYIKQRHRYDRLTRQAGFSNLHGLRHAYAQRRYAELTTLATQGQGWQAPLAGGKPRHQLTAAEKRIDYHVRAMIARELGHSRNAITVVYLN